MPEWLREWWPVIAFLVPLLLVVIAWAIRKGLVTRDEFETRSAQLVAAIEAEGKNRVELASAVSRIELKLGQLTTRDDVHNLNVALAEFKGDLKALGTGMTSLGDRLDRVDRTLARHEQIFSEAARK
jgi:hypothetical protein